MASLHQSAETSPLALSMMTPAAAPPRGQSSSCTCTYERVPAANLPTIESLGYMLGKTLGSGTYAKVKAAWSPVEKELVSHGNCFFFPCMHDSMFALCHCFYFF